MRCSFCVFLILVLLYMKRRIFLQKVVQLNVIEESHIKMYCRLREGPAFKNNTLENYAAEKTKKNIPSHFLQSTQYYTCIKQHCNNNRSFRKHKKLVKLFLHVVNYKMSTLQDHKVVTIMKFSGNIISWFIKLETIGSKIQKRRLCKILR